MERVIQGFLAAARTGASQEEDGVLGGTLELPREDHDDEPFDVSDRDLQLEQAARRSILALAHIPQDSPSRPGETTSFDLLAVFRSLGAAGRQEVLQTAELQAALVRLWRESTDAISLPVDDDATVAAAAANVAARMIGADPRGELDYRLFEDWVLPPRGFAELRGVMIELAVEGSALGLTAAELFLQFGGGAGSGGSAADSDTVGSRELRERLGTLSIHLTDTEVETLMVGAGCAGGNTHGYGRLTLGMFVALVENPLGQRQRAQAEGSATGTATALFGSQLAVTDTGSSTRERREDFHSAPVEEEGRLTPYSLAPIMSPRMSLSELVGAEEGIVGPGTAASSAAAHAEAFGRVAIDVQEVPAAVVTSAAGHRGDSKCTTGGSQSESRERGRSAVGQSFRTVDSLGSMVGSAAASRKQDAKGTEEGFVGVQIATSRPAASDSDPVPRTRAITPPLGPARSPSEPLHPTRASRERLTAALATLDLKEFLKPTVASGEHTSGQRSYSSAGGRLPASAGVAPGFSRNGMRSAEKPLAASAAFSSRRASAAGNRGSPKGVAAAAVAPCFGASGDGNGTQDGRCITTAKAKAVGVDADGPRARRSIGFSVDRKRGRAGGSGGGGGGGVEERWLEEAAASGGGGGDDDGMSDGGSGDTPEVIGRLRAKVAELELTEQLLRCELEGAHADLVTNRRRAVEEAREVAGKAKERESAVQARMRARLRAAEAEAAAAEKRLAEFKRSSAADTAAREKSSAEYLRRRLQEAEAALEAKTARRLAKQLARCPGYRKGDCADSSTVESGVAEGIGKTLPQRASRRKNAGLGGAGDFAAATKQREELLACRKKLAVATGEASRLRARLASQITERGEEEGERGGKRISTSAEATCRAGSHDKACHVCGGEGGRHRGKPTLVGSRERRKERERRLEARLVESEDARIAVEAEAERLQAFVDEMRGLGPPVSRARRVWLGAAD